jgi:hypothetical protein
MVPIRGRTPLARHCTAAAAGVALLIPLVPAAATAATAADPAPDVGLRALAPTAADDYVSRPDIAAPGLTTTTTEDAASGLLMTTTGTLTGDRAFGAAIYRNDGELVWWKGADDGGSYIDMEPVTFRDEPALAVFHGLYGGVDPSRASYEVLDTSYNEIASFTVEGEAVTDMHDIEFSPDGSHALLLGVRDVPYDLSEMGGPADGTIIDHVVQEIDVETGEVAFEWSFLDNIPLAESQAKVPSPSSNARFDPYHTNSVAYDSDGNLLVSARHTSTTYKLDATSGDVIWRFGGKNSDFTFADPDDRPSYQHDVRRLSDGRLSLFDNGNLHNPQYSRGAVYDIDEVDMTADLVEDLRPDAGIYAESMGSTRQLFNGNQLVSYGPTGEMIEFDGTEPVFTGTLEEEYVTYRAERAPWHATPDTRPDAVLRDGTMYMSWNGATDVERWRVAAGPSEDDLTPVGTVERTGFETAAEVTAPDDAAVYRITALGPGGDPLGSRTITP